MGDELTFDVLGRLITARVASVRKVEWGDFRAGGFRDLEHQWFWDGQEHVDPAKEANAQAMRLQNHTTTLAYEFARQGRDWESELRQRGKELKLMNELGLTVAQSAAAQEMDPDQADEQTEQPTARAA